MASGNISAGKNIQFLLGTQANLEKYISGSSTAIEGTFYLTNDTHRLYVGTSAGTAVPVNEGVITVSNIDALQHVSAHPGEFYYVTAGNILCVYDGKQWVQINNNTDTYLAKTDTVVSLADQVATITTKYTMNSGTTDISDSWNLAVAEGVKVSIDAATDKVILTGVVNDSFGVSAASNIATVTLRDSFNNEKTFKVKTGDITTMTVGASAEGDAVVLNVKDMSNTALKVTPEATGFKVAVTDIMGTQSDVINPSIKVGASSDDTKHKTLNFVNGTATLPIYTKEEIDDIKLALNAMTYRGLVGTSASSANPQKVIKAWATVKNGSAEIGDTYLFAEQVTDGSNVYSKGTMAIARGVETNGVIPAGNVIWDFVESTVNTDTKYELNNQATAAGAKGFVQLVGKLGGTTEAGKKVFFEDGTAIKASVSVDNDGHAHVSFSHEGITAAQTTGTVTQSAATYASSDHKAESVTTITALESITVNAQGHVTNFKTNTITLKDTNAVINSVGMSVGAANAAKEVVLTSSVQLKDGAGTIMTAKSGTLKMKSDTLVFNQKDGGASLGIDLVWGSFN